ncbi:Trihydroxynaphthalene reductase [Brettanomyces nanus]|uniref:Homoserine kinase n=1 Tax=Eeniella nana TaxID=13502 RepID=A0A875S8C1_EENNA|nr:Trihydroxynaphthalene reductase [Brettanomyces nanus]QPG75364.1 Trihydroxynaphthalene reductase [Brettanomyces nanus]
MSREFTIKVPASSANIGPGFDVLGIALNLYLSINVKIDAHQYGELSLQDPNNCILSYEGEGADVVPLQSDKNLLTQMALYVLRCHGINHFPLGTKISVHNQVPFGRGLGSSGTAVVGGALLGNAIGELGLSKQRCLDYCLMVERHPDNISATMMGGFVGSFLRQLSDKGYQLVHQPLKNVLENFSADSTIDAPLNLGTHVTYNWCQKIKCVAIIPQFEVSTSKSRSVLPESYKRADVVFNLQRLAVLTSAVGSDIPDPALIYPAMQDRLHQPYRKALIPGLSSVVSEFTPQTHTGLLGICLSGAGPTILCLATENFERIARDIVARFKQEKVECKWLLLEPAYDGATVEEVSKL